MTIQEFAVEHGISKGTIYNAIKKSSFDLKQITSGGGQITPEGMTILKSLFPASGEPEKGPESLRPPEELQQIRDALKEAEGGRERLQTENEELRNRLRRAEEKAEQWEKRYFELQEKAERERAEYRQQVTEAHKLISQEQEIKHVSILKRLFAERNRETVTAEGQIK